MKRIKSCSTLRIKAHQLLNEEEREVFKYAIRNYRKNQSIDALCEIISKIITNSNRSCLVSIISDMLKEEQKSQFLHRCYSKVPGFNLSQNNLTKSEIQVNKDFKSSNLSLRVATFVSKNRLNQSKSNYHLDQSSTCYEDGGSTLKLNNDKIKKNSDPLNKKKTLMHSESEELLKTIERCNRKERPTLSNLKDKGFWSHKDGNATDDDLSNSSHSFYENNNLDNKKVTEDANAKDTPRFHSKVKSVNRPTVNGERHGERIYSDSQRNSKDRSKLMVCKLHFSSVNILKESEEAVENISISTQSAVVSLLHSNSFDDIYIEYNLPVFSELSPMISPMNAIFQPKPFENNLVLHRPLRLQNYKHVSYSNDLHSQNKKKETGRKAKDTKECQTSFVNTCDSSTQTFLA